MSPPDDDGRTERALKLLYSVVLPRLLRRHAETQLGYARPFYIREFGRSQRFFEQMAGEMGDWWWRLARASEAASDDGGRRIEWRHLEDAALELLDVVRTFPAPVRRVIEMRSSGLSWRRIVADLPDRVWFSVRDDWDFALSTLWLNHASLVARIA